MAKIAIQMIITRGLHCLSRHIYAHIAFAFERQNIFCRKPERVTGSSSHLLEEITFGVNCVRGGPTSGILNS